MGWVLCVFSHAQHFVTSMDCRPPGSSVHGVFQAKILELTAIFSSMGSSWPRDQTHDSCNGRWALYHLHHLRSLKMPVSSTILIKLLSWIYLSSSRYHSSFLCSLLPWWKSPWKDFLYLMSSMFFSMLF